jgi:hypothetical protein
MKKVTSAKANDDLTLDLEFGDGKIRRFDTKPYLDKGIFKQLRDVEYFKKVRVSYGTVQWENEQDFAPETLYLESEVIE